MVAHLMLSISEYTAATHGAKILNKVVAKSRSQIAMSMTERGLPPFNRG
jgi:DNA-binding CsgD family transcriptional regulator